MFGGVLSQRKNFTANFSSIKVYHFYFLFFHRVIVHQQHAAYVNVCVCVCCALNDYRWGRARPPFPLHYIAPSTAVEHTLSLIYSLCLALKILCSKWLRERESARAPRRFRGEFPAYFAATIILTFDRTEPSVLH